MATDWAADVKKYAANADDAIIKGLVRYCGIALTKVDSSLVAFSDPKELDRVRNNFLKKKLGRTDADSVLDAAIAKVGETMKADRTKNRVTVYYLLADHFGQLGLFMPKGAAATKTPAKKAAAKPVAKTALKAAGAAAVVAGAVAAAKKPAAKKSAPAKKAAAPAAKLAAPAKKKVTTKTKAAVATAAVGGAVGLASAIPAAAKDTAVKAADAVADTAKAAGGAAVSAGTVAAGAVGAAAAGAAALAGSTASKAASAVSGGAQALTGGGDEDSGLGWLWWLLGLALLLFAAWWFFGRAPSTDAARSSGATAEVSAVASEDAAVALASAPAEGTAAIPDGAGVTTEMRDGKPVVKVYFATGKTDVAPTFTGSATGLKQWLTDHPGSKLAISGYADPTGNAARNAQLAKQRAGAVQAQLVAAGIPAEQAEMVKPAASTDTTVPKEAARRVEVVVQ